MELFGRLSEQKDPITTIKAFKNVNEKYSNTKLIYVGSGELDNDVKEYAKENNILDKVIITGWVNDVEKYIPTFDIALLPSKWEGFGLVLIEYMACDKPIIASKIGGIQNIINDRENGLLFETEDYKQLCDSVVELIEDSTLKNNIINNNKIRRQKYNVQNEVNKTKNIFDSIIIGG